MPADYRITTAQCTSVGNPIFNIRGYVQWLGSEYPTCTCPAYRYAKRTVNVDGTLYPPECKHIKQAHKDWCGWMQFIDGEAPVKDPDDSAIIYCPKCGERAEYVSMLV